MSHKLWLHNNKVMSSYFDLDVVLNEHISEIAKKHKVAYYQVDAACSVFMTLNRLYHNFYEVLNGDNDRDTIINYLDKCAKEHTEPDTFVEHYYKTFMKKVLFSEKFNKPFEGITLFAIVAELANKAILFSELLNNKHMKKTLTREVVTYGQFFNTMDDHFDAFIKAA